MLGVSISFFKYICFKVSQQNGTPICFTPTAVTKKGVQMI